MCVVVCLTLPRNVINGECQQNKEKTFVRLTSRRKVLLTAYSLQTVVKWKSAPNNNSIIPWNMGKVNGIIKGGYHLGRKNTRNILIKLMYNFDLYFSSAQFDSSSINKE